MPITKQHFRDAAAIVNSIREGHWTNEAPIWADASFMRDTSDAMAYTRAVWTAEAFIKVFREYNPRFNETTFLRACGLVS